MTTTLKVGPNEVGLLRVFSLATAHMSKDDLRAIQGEDKATTLFSAPKLVEDGLEVFPVTELEDIGLTQYLLDGWGIEHKQADSFRNQLENIKDHVVILRSRAFGGNAQTLNLQPGLHLVTTFEEPGEILKFQTLRTDITPTPSTKKSASPPPKSNSALYVTLALLLVILGAVALVFSSS